MAQIRINFSGVSSANDALKKQLRELEDIISTLKTAENKLPDEIKSRYRIAQNLSQARKTASDLSGRIKKMQSVTAAAVASYQTTEKNLNEQTKSIDFSQKKR